LPTAKRSGTPAKQGHRPYLIILRVRIGVSAAPASRLLGDVVATHSRCRDLASVPSGVISVLPAGNCLFWPEGTLHELCYTGIGVGAAPAPHPNRSLADAIKKLAVDINDFPTCNHHFLMPRRPSALSQSIRRALWGATAPLEILICMNAGLRRRAV
jgi:hypothetical protein